jgi:ATP-dependent DNA ligase
VEAVNTLKVQSYLIDGQTVTCEDNGIAVFKLLNQEQQGRHIFLYTFDLLELDGKDLRPELPHLSQRQVQELAQV